MGEEERRWLGLSLADCAQTITPKKLLVILHSLAVTVEQLCAKSADAPPLEKLRPQYCVICGQAARNADGVLQLVGHGMYARQVCGLVETGWIIVWIRRFLCLVCGHTMSLLADSPNKRVLGSASGYDASPTSDLGRYVNFPRLLQSSQTRNDTAKSC